MNLIFPLIRREIAGRYRGSALGILWSLLTPLFMLAVFTFVFGTVFQARWSDGNTSTSEFAIILFSGLILFNFFAEVVNRAPNLVLSQANLVKKIVFPLEVLPIVAVGSAIFHLAVSFAVLLIFMVIVMGGVPPTALWLPLVIVPFVLVTLGIGYFLASLGVYLRDTAQLIGTLLTALMFLSPIFFPSTALPEWIRPFLFLNPVSLPVEQAREVLIWRNYPDFAALLYYGAISVAVFALGRLWFEKTRKGFADVL